MKRIKTIFVWLLLIACIPVCASCEEKDPLVGTFYYTDDDAEIYFFEKNNYLFTEYRKFDSAGTYKISGDKITINDLHDYYTYTGIIKDSFIVLDGEKFEKDYAYLDQNQNNPLIGKCYECSLENYYSVRTPINHIYFIFLSDSDIGLIVNHKEYKGRFGYSYSEDTDKKIDGYEVYGFTKGIISKDGKKIYMQNPHYEGEVFEFHLIEGKLDLNY